MGRTSAAASTCSARSNRARSNRARGPDARSVQQARAEAVDAPGDSCDQRPHPRLSRRERPSNPTAGSRGSCPFSRPVARPDDGNGRVVVSRGLAAAAAAEPVYSSKTLAKFLSLVFARPAAELVDLAQ